MFLVFPKLEDLRLNSHLDGPDAAFPCHSYHRDARAVKATTSGALSLRLAPMNDSPQPREVK